MTIYLYSRRKIFTIVKTLIGVFCRKYTYNFNSKSLNAHNYQSGRKDNKNITGNEISLYTQYTFHQKIISKVTLWHLFSFYGLTAPKTTIYHGPVKI